MRIWHSSAIPARAASGRRSISADSGSAMYTMLRAASMRGRATSTQMFPAIDRRRFGILQNRLPYRLQDWWRIFEEGLHAHSRDVADHIDAPAGRLRQ